MRTNGTGNDDGSHGSLPSVWTLVGRRYRAHPTDRTVDDVGTSPPSTSVQHVVAHPGRPREPLEVGAAVVGARAKGSKEVAGARRRLAQRGATAVEFALVAPIMILLALGIIDFGLYINAGSVVGNASREGARAASLGGSSSNVNAVVTASLSALPGSGTTTISVTCRKPAGSNCSSYSADAISGGTAIVSITRVHHWLTPMGFGTTVDIVGKSEMRIE